MNVLSQSRAGSLKNTIRQMIEEFYGLSALTLPDELIYVCNEELVDKIEWFSAYEYITIKEIKYNDHYLRVKYIKRKKSNGETAVMNYAIPYENIILCQGLSEYNSDE